MKINPYPKLLYFMALLFLWNTVSGQQSNCKITLCKNKPPKTHTVELSPEGKIVSEVPEFILINDKIVISVKDTATIRTGINGEMKKILNASLSALKSKEAQKNLVNYFYLFIESGNINLQNDTVVFKKEIEQVRDDINAAVNDVVKKGGSEFVPSLPIDGPVFSLTQPQIPTKDNKKNKFEFEYRKKTLDALKVEWMKSAKPEELELPSRKEILAYDSIFDDIDKVIVKAQGVGISCGEAETLKTKLESIDGIIEEMLKVPLKNWLKKWIWINGTSFQLNPFSKGESKLFGNDDKILIESIPSIEAKLSAFKLVLEKNESLDGKIVMAITDSISELTAVLNKASKLKADQIKAESVPARKYFHDELLYKGHLYVSRKDKEFFMRNHDAANDYEIMGKLNKYYLEDSKVKYLVQNQVEGKESKLFESVVVADDIPIFTSFVLEGFKIVQNIRPDVNTLTGSSVKSITIPVVKKECDTLGLIKMVQRFQIARAKNNWLMEQGELQPIPELLSDETPKYRTDEAGPGKSVEAPAKVTYVLKEHVIGTPSDSVSFATVDSVSYNVYSLHRFQPFAGFAFGSVKRNKLNIDGSGNLLSVEREKEQNTFMGIKIYPVKTDIHNPKFIWATGRDFWSRLNFVVGMDFTNINPVDNFIGGVGVDLVPGLNIAYYGNYYKNNTYKIEQGKFIKDGRPLMFDHGFMISLDPVVIFNFAKLIAKP